MAKIPWFCKAKGGVGKSMIAATIAQYKSRQGTEAALHRHRSGERDVRGLQSPQRAPAQHHGRRRSTPEFRRPGRDDRVGRGDVIIDNRANSFVPLSHYLISNQVPALLQDMGHELVVHTVVTGGQALVDTVSGFAQLASQFPAECLFVVWLNPY